MNALDDLRDHLRRYYGEHLTHSGDLATNACCASGAPPSFLLGPLSRIDASVTDRFYGCGFPIPTGLRDAHVVDLGCGTGRDVYLLSQLVGAAGFVHGVDMTEAQLAVGRAAVDLHTDRFGFPSPNVAFHEAFIEDLSPLGLAPGSQDVIVSNCVINLSPHKDRVLAEAFRLLKDGGELYVSDVVCDRRLPADVSADPLLHAECLGGALYVHDFLDLARRTGFLDPRTVRRAPITINHPEIEARVGAARFESLTVRLFKLPGLAPRCEDHGQVATYLGGMPEAPAVFWLDDHHAFEAGRPERVCSNTAAMLAQTRFARWFHVTAEGPHFGEFPCGPTMAAGIHAVQATSGACC